MSILTDAPPAEPGTYDELAADVAELAAILRELADNGDDLYRVVLSQHRLIGLLMQRVDALEGGAR